jgi:hypothetical protein
MSKRNPSRHPNCMTTCCSHKISPSFAIAVLFLACAIPGQSQIFKATPVLYESGGNLAKAVAVSDLNKDGKADVIVVNSGASPAGSVGVLLGNGDGTFQSAASYPVHWGADAVAVRDLNGDGWPDIVVGINDGAGVTSLLVLLNNGDASFQSAVGYASGGFDIRSVAIADVNGDGKLDVVALDQADATFRHSEIAVLLGNGDGTLQSAVNYELTGGGTNALSLTAADLNRDGRPDLVVTDYDTKSSKPVIYVLLNRGDGTLALPVPYSTGAFGTSLVLGDVNHDGKLDAIISSNSGQVGVLFGDGNGAFGAAAVYPSGLTNPSSVAIGDFNGDGVADLAVTDSVSAGKLAVLLNNGHGAFGTPVIYGTGGRSANGVAAANLNHDGKPDLVVANRCDGFTYTCPLGGGIAVLLGVPANTTTKVTTSGTPSQIGQAVTFKAAVTATEGPIPNGTIITFYNNGTKMGTAKTMSGIAKFSTSSLSVGTHAIKASFPSSAYFKASSGTVSQMVN